MEKIVLVTGNKNKLKEFESIFGDENFQFENEKYDLDEIQSMDLGEICEHKVRQAYDLIERSVIVEDTGFFLDELKGLPGPFLKFFEEKLGNGALSKLLGDSENRKGVARTCIAYYDGKNIIKSYGEVEGNILKNVDLEGEGFGFDFCFVPSGYNKTFSQMGLDEKNKISQRRKAIENFKKDISGLI
ncbi:MAG: non-canonical purine NTP pyrophosphatase [Nanoarchaeota archaeon]|nr:non-canonical purine NTP pyrophosphatase [Nanoarchaeota archaeon]